MNKLSPKLVDYSLFNKKNLIKKKVNPIIISNKNHFLLNIIGFLLIILIGFGLYYRYKNKNINKENNIHNIISFNEYIKNNNNNNNNENKN